MDPITTAECIHVYQSSRLQSDSFTPEAMTAAYVAGLAALHEKAERESPSPLTPAEIQQMRGEPAWCQEAKAWGIIKIDRIGQWADKPFLQLFWLQDEDAPCGVDCEWDIQKRGLTLYRNKPPEEGRERP